jgi:hypothetical protein
MTYKYTFPIHPTHQKHSQALAGERQGELMSTLFSDAAYVLDASIRIEVSRLIGPQVTLSSIIEKLPDVVPEAVMAAYDDLIMNKNDH